MKIIDTHAHYDEDAFDLDRDFLLTSGLKAGDVELVVNMGASMEGAEKSAELAEKYPMVYAGCGIHPDDCGIFEEAENAEDTGSSLRGELTPDWSLAAHAENSALLHLRELLFRPKVVCIGEIGLDYHWMVQSKEIQQKWFAIQLQLAAELGFPINVHSREASQDTFDVIVKNHTKNGKTITGGIIHAYSGSAEMAREYVKLGYHIGVGGVVTFKNGKKLRGVVESIPLEALVTETDCPYMSPEPVRGSRNDSRNIRHVIAKIAEIKGMDIEDCAAVLYQNALSVYRI